MVLSESIRINVGMFIFLTLVYCTTKQLDRFARVFCKSKPIFSQLLRIFFPYHGFNKLLFIIYRNSPHELVSTEGVAAAVFERMVKDGLPILLDLGHLRLCCSALLRNIDLNINSKVYVIRFQWNTI